MKLTITADDGNSMTVDLGNDQFNNARVLLRLKPDEPFFVLRGQDRLASQAVRHWANLADRHNVPAERVVNADKCAGAMMQWHPRKYPD